LVPIPDVVLIRLEVLLFIFILFGLALVPELFVAGTFIVLEALVVFEDFVSVEVVDGFDLIDELVLLDLVGGC